MKIREWRVKGGQVNVSKRIEGQETKRTEIKSQTTFSPIRTGSASTRPHKYKNIKYPK